MKTMNGIELSPITLQIKLENCFEIKNCGDKLRLAGGLKEILLRNRHSIRETIVNGLDAQNISLSVEEENCLVHGISEHLWQVVHECTYNRLNFRSDVYPKMGEWPLIDSSSPLQPGPLTDAQWAAVFLRLSKQGGSAFDCVLSVIERIAAEYGKMYSNNLELIDITGKRNQSELDQLNSYDQRGRDELSLKHQEEMELLRATIGSSLEEQYRQHRQTFRRLVIELDEAAQMNPNIDLSVDPFLKMTSSKKEEPSEMLTDANPVLELVGMGFEHKHAECALSLANNNLDTAIVILLEQPERVEEALHRHNHFPPDSAAKKSGWKSTENFFERKLEEFSSSKPNIKSLAGWIDKAKSKVESELSSRIQNRNELDVVSLMDSFTITFGSHVKQTQNLRISNSPFSYFFGHQDVAVETKRAIMAQNNAMLYTKRLNAIVLVHQSSDFRSVLQRPTFKDFINACGESPELHFDSVEKQIDLIGQDFKNGAHPGDIFITRHSNLSNIHIVFHLISADCKSNIECKAASSAGLKNVFRLASEIGLQQLSLPLFFDFSNVVQNSGADSKKSLFHLLGAGVHSSQNKTGNQNASDSVFSVAEYILKICKGFLVESTRSYHKHVYRDDETSSTAESFIGTLEFLVPSDSTHQDFSVYRELICSIFRTI